MMQALVDPRDGRIFQLAETGFPVAPPLAWVEAPEGVTERHVYLDGVFAPPPGPDTTMLRAMVNAERDRRTAAGFTFGGVQYQARPIDVQNITGAGALAGLALFGGAQAGDYRWHGGSEDFQWIAEDDSRVSMDAPTCFAFAKAAMAHVSAHVFAGNSIKALLGTPAEPADIADDTLWP